MVPCYTRPSSAIQHIYQPHASSQCRYRARDNHKTFEMDKWNLKEGVFTRDRARILVEPAILTELLAQHLSAAQQREAGRKLGEMLKAEAKFQGQDVHRWADYVWRTAGAGKLIFGDSRVKNTNPALPVHVVAGLLEGLLDVDAEVGPGAVNAYVLHLKPRP